MPAHLASPSYTRANPATRSAPLLAFCVLASLFCGAYAECLHNIAACARTGVQSGLFFGVLTAGTVVRTLAIACVVLAGIWLVVLRRGAFEWVVRHRLVLAAVLLVALVALGISGSSLGMWSSFFAQGLSDDVLFGIPREIRSDEWCVFTPFSLAQEASDNAAVSSIIRGGGTNVTMVYAQPSWAVATLFRPFLWGYLVLGGERGLSFFWCARAIALVLVTFELMRLLSNGRPMLAAYGALLVGFAPIVEWWFAVNGTVELLVFGQGLVLALHHLLRTHGTARRWGWSALLAWLLGCYALIIYPAWQIPFVYVFGALGVADALRWRKEARADEADVERASARTLLVPLLACVGVCVAGVGLAVAGAWDAIATSLHTVYPGERFFTGGGLEGMASNPVTTVVSSLWPDLFNGNVCESAAFVSLAPMGLALCVVALVRGAQYGKADAFAVGLLVPFAFLFAYGFVGFPHLLARVSLMSYVFTQRLQLPLGYLHVALLVRGVALLNGERAEVAGVLRKTLPESDSAPEVVLESVPKAATAHERGLWTSVAVRIALCLVLTGVAVWVARTGCPQLMGAKASAFVGASFFLLLAPLCLPTTFLQRAGGRETWLVVSALVVVVAGLCVNPVQRGTAALTSNPDVQDVARIVQNDPSARWITDVSQDGQACVAVGAPTVTSVNVYPNLELWRKLDPSDAQEDVYNRYAFIEVGLADQTSFELVANDKFYVHIRPEDVPKLGATYWLSRHDLSQWNTPAVQFVPVEKNGTLHTFRIEAT